MITQPLDEWRKEASVKFGARGRNWKFFCPKCGNVQSGQDFVDRGHTLEQAANNAYVDCIGRHFEGVGCNWAAYGLFGTLGKGRIVIDEDGKEHEIFDFAPVEEVS